MDALKLLEFWKRELRLQDWTITVKVIETHPSEDGSSEVTPERRVAHVVLTKDDLDPESTLVHELLHCYVPLHRFKKGSFEYVAAEQGIDLVAELLVRNRRDAESRKLADKRGVRKRAAKRESGRAG